MDLDFEHLYSLDAKFLDLFVKKNPATNPSKGLSGPSESSDLGIVKSKDFPGISSLDFVGTDGVLTVLSQFLGSPALCGPPRGATAEPLRSHCGATAEQPRSHRKGVLEQAQMAQELSLIHI